MHLFEKIFKITLLALLLLLLLGSGACVLIDISLLGGSLSSHMSRFHLGNLFFYLVLTTLAALIAYWSYRGMRWLARDLWGENDSAADDGQRR